MLTLIKISCCDGLENMRNLSIALTNDYIVFFVISEISVLFNMKVTEIGVNFVLLLGTQKKNPGVGWNPTKD
jgi:hypothetical protein